MMVVGGLGLAGLDWGGWLVVEGPLVLSQKGVNHFLHGQVGDELVHSEVGSGDGVKVAHTLTKHTNKRGGKNAILYTEVL